MAAVWDSVDPAFEVIVGETVWFIDSLNVTVRVTLPATFDSLIVESLRTNPVIVGLTPSTLTVVDWTWVMTS